MERVRPGRVSSRAFVTSYLLAVVVTAGVHTALPASVKALAYAVTAFVPVIAIPVGIRVNRIARPMVWKVLTASLGLIAVGNTVRGIGDIRGHLPGEDTLLAVIYPVTYLGVLTAACIIAAQHAPHDAGRVIDAALIGVCGAGMLWEWVLRPRLAAAYQAPTHKIAVLISTLALMAVLGALLHVMRTIGRARATLGLVFVSLSCAVVGRVFDQIGYYDRTYPLWIVSNISLAAAALHPAASYSTTPASAGTDRVTGGRLVRLGLILAVIPLVGGVPQLFGQPPDGLLLTVGALITIPLVLIRIGQLARQRTEAEHALAYQAAHDELTGLPNRRTVLEALDRAVERLHASELDQLTVLFCDLDGFKPVNDRLGHQAGDEVLRIAGARLRDCLRASDLIGRFGGDEFLIVCPHTGEIVCPHTGEIVCPHTGEDDIASRVERLFDEPLRISTGTVTLGVSVGVAVAHRGTVTSADALVAAADDAMYAVKRARRATAR